MFDQFFPAAVRRNSNLAWAPQMDFVERQEAFLITLDVPGMKKDDFNVDFHDGTLTISGERATTERSESDLVLRAERSYGQFTRTFALPRTVNDKKIEASYADGVLTVVVPKSEESKPRRIKIS
jgi:HSP20 family protein